MAATGRSRARSVLRTAVSLAVVAAILWLARSQVDFGEVATTIGDMSWLEILTLSLAGAWNIASYLFVMMAALPGLTYRQAFIVGQASTAIAVTVPAGSAVGIGVTYAMYASYGLPGPAIALAAVVTGLWNNFLKLAMPVVALALVALSGAATGDLQTAALVGLVVLAAAVAVFALLLWRERFARAVGAVAARVAAPVARVLRRPPPHGWDDGVARFRGQTIGLLRRRWAALTVATLASHLSLYLVLLLALRHVGVPASDVSWQEALAAFAIMRLLSAVPITPGGLGVVELGLSAALVVAGGARAPVVAAVLVFRLLTLVVQVPVGAVAYLVWARDRRRGVAARADAAPVPAEPRPLVEP